MSTLSDKFNRALSRSMAGKEFENRAELQAFLNQFIGRNIDDLVASQELSPADQAMERVDLAMEAESEAEALGHLREALRLDPKCCEARIHLAQWESRSDTELLRRLEEAISDEKERLGPDCFKENKGHFWGMHETRPYMRACLDRALALMVAGRLDEAQKALRDLILLNRHDNQGVRMILGPLCLRRGDLKAYRALRNKFKGVPDLELLWGDVLEAFLLGDLEAAGARRRAAREENGYLEAYLRGHRNLPKRRPGSYTWKNPEHAVSAAVHLVPAWAAHPQAVAWLNRAK